MKKTVRIVLTGGHAATTALAVVEEILKRNKNWELFWIGPKRAIEGKGILTSASLVLPKYGVYHYPIVAGRFSKKWTRWTVPSLLKIPVGFIHAFLLLTKLKPKVILSFGGYGAFPVVVIGWALGIPVVIHAQTIAVGLANRLSSLFARKIAISRKESKEILPRAKTVLTGNPVMSRIIEVGPKKEIGDPPTIYVTGGATGAQRINKVVDAILPLLLKDFNLIHQTGELDYEYFSKRRKKLESNLKGRYEPKSFIDPVDVWKTYKRADILISRAGANTISEILITKRPSILVPIPWSTFDEQNKNAALAQKAGIAVVIQESELTPQSLLQNVFSLAKDWGKVVKKSDNSQSRLDARASQRLVDLLEESLL